MVLPELWRMLGLEERPAAFEDIAEDVEQEDGDGALDPIEELARLGSRAGLDVAPRRMRVTDAVWLGCES
jgi:hypothetical protein